MRNIDEISSIKSIFYKKIFDIICLFDDIVDDSKNCSCESSSRFIDELQHKSEGIFGGKKVPDEDEITDLKMHLEVLEILCESISLELKEARENYRKKQEEYEKKIDELETKIVDQYEYITLLKSAKSNKAIREISDILNDYFGEDESE